jgi:hypothetical protein
VTRTINPVCLNRRTHVHIMCGQISQRTTYGPIIRGWFAARVGTAHDIVDRQRNDIGPGVPTSPRLSHIGVSAPPSASVPTRPRTSGHWFHCAHIGEVFAREIPETRVGICPRIELIQQQDICVYLLRARGANLRTECMSIFLPANAGRQTPRHCPDCTTWMWSTHVDSAPRSVA